MSKVIHGEYYTKQELVDMYPRIGELSEEELRVILSRLKKQIAMKKLKSPTNKRRAPTAEHRGETQCSVVSLSEWKRSRK